MTLTRALSAECWFKNKIGSGALETVCADSFLKGVIMKKAKMDQMFERSIGPKILGLFLFTDLVVRRGSMV